MSLYLAETLLYSTMLIENQWGGKGTGFLVSRIINEKEGKVFLVTNKHVLNESSSLRDEATHIFLHHNIENSQGIIEKCRSVWPLIFPDRSKLWKEHPNIDVDVLVFDAGFLNTGPRLKARWVDFDLLCSSEMLREIDITIGQEVIVIGYPLGFSHRKSNLPLFRSGIIATCIGEELEDTTLEDEVERTRILRGFLVDGGIIPGSSGSPVVFKPGIGRITRDGVINLGESPPPFILGIISETRYSPIRTPEFDHISYAGLGLAFDAQTIRETIDQWELW